MGSKPLGKLQRQIQISWNDCSGRWDWSYIPLQMAGMILLLHQKGYAAPIKSIGNSTTTPRDLTTNLDAKIIFMALSESVSARLRKHGFKCNVVSISIRDNGYIHLQDSRN